MCDRGMFEGDFVRDKVYCALTGQLIGVGQESVKMHMEGKKFRKVLDCLIRKYLGREIFLN